MEILIETELENEREQCRNKDDRLYINKELATTSRDWYQDQKTDGEGLVGERTPMRTERPVASTSQQAP